MNRLFVLLAVALSGCAFPVSPCWDLMDEEGGVCAVNENATVEGGNHALLAIYQEESFEQNGRTQIVDLSVIGRCGPDDSFCRTGVDVYPYIHLARIQTTADPWIMCILEGEPLLLGDVQINQNPFDIHDKYGEKWKVTTCVKTP